MKIGVSLMISHNLDQSAGVCNGTNAILTRCTSRFLKVKIETGNSAGEIAFSPHTVND